MPVDLQRVLHRPHVGEPALAQRLGVLRLAQHGRSPLQQRDRGVVEVVGVQVGDEHDLRPRGDLLGRLGQLHQRVAAVVRRVRDRAAGLGGVEHRVDEQAAPAVVELERRVADQAQSHRCTVSAHDPHPGSTRRWHTRRRGRAADLRHRGRGDDRRASRPACAPRASRSRSPHDGPAGVELCRAAAARPRGARPHAARARRARGLPPHPARPARPGADAHRARRRDGHARRPRRRRRRLHDQAVLAARARRAGARAPAPRRARAGAPRRARCASATLEVDPAARRVRVERRRASTSRRPSSTCCTASPTRPGVGAHARAAARRGLGLRGRRRRSARSTRTSAALRRKLGADVIRTVHGVGYALEAETAREAARPLGSIKLKLGVVIVGRGRRRPRSSLVGDAARAPPLAAVAARGRARARARPAARARDDVAAAGDGGGRAAMARGDYGRRVTATSRDEVGELARAFNAMAAELGRGRPACGATSSPTSRTSCARRSARCRRVLENLVDGVERPTRERRRAGADRAARPAGRAAARPLAARVGRAPARRRALPRSASCSTDAARERVLGERDVRLRIDVDADRPRGRPATPSGSSRCSRTCSTTRSATRPPDGRVWLSAQRRPRHDDRGQRRGPGHPAGRGRARVRALLPHRRAPARPATAAPASASRSRAGSSSARRQHPRGAARPARLPDGAGAAAGRARQDRTSRTG